jgi:BASS family bile acid:Na+ symporter
MQQLIGLAVNVSMFLIVLALGLKATEQEATSLFRNPALFLKSLASMNLVMAVVATLIAVVFNPAPEVKIALVVLALSPVPPILPGKQMKSGGSQSYTIGLLVAAALASVVVIPVGLFILDVLFNLQMSVSLGAIVGIVLVSVLLPLSIGIVVRGAQPSWAARLAGPISIIGWLLLVAAVIPVLIFSWPGMLSLLGQGLVWGLLAFSLLGLGVGHLLGGPDPDNRTVLALASSARHPGMAITLAGLNFPDSKLVAVVILYHLLIGIIVAVPYVQWRTREHAASHKEAV